jgi:hypothetical protein
MRVNALGLDWVAAQLARHSAGQLCNRLLQQWFGF